MEQGNVTAEKGVNGVYAEGFIFSLRKLLKLPFSAVKVIAEKISKWSLRRDFFILLGVKNRSTDNCYLFFIS